MSFLIKKKVEQVVKPKSSKKLLKFTAGAAVIGVGTICTYKALKNKMQNNNDNYMYDEDELNVDKIYENSKNTSELEVKVSEFNSRRINHENSTDATPEEMQHYLDNIEDDKKHAKVNEKDYNEDEYDEYES